MKIFNNIFLGKKILIYGLGKSGISSYKFLKKKSDIYLFDDNQKIDLKLKKKIVRIEQIKKIMRENADEIKDCAIKTGMRTLLNYGLELVKQQLTSLEEVERVCLLEESE